MTAAVQPPQYLVDTQVVAQPPAMQSTSLISDTGVRQIALQVSQPAAEWIRSALARIEDLTALTPGWDGYSARVIDATVAVQAVRFVLDHAYPSLPEPAIVPTSDGGIQIEWHRGGIDFEVSISNEESSVFIEDAETGQSDEQPVDQANAIFGTIIGRLATRA